MGVFPNSGDEQGAEMDQTQKSQRACVREMVESSLVPIGEKVGSGEADKAADKGATAVDERLRCFAEK